MNKNEAKVTGRITGALKYSHEVYGEKFYTTSIESVRKSGVTDQIPLTISDRIMSDISSLEGRTVSVTGQFRSFNKHEGEKNHLVLTLFATEVKILDDVSEDDDAMNVDELHIDGFICKEPIYRKTPQGREICDLLIASNRAYDKSDYIPCICWGRNARYTSTLAVGTLLNLVGRIQSREYNKKINEAGDTETRIAYEVSVSKVDIAEKVDNVEEE